MVPNEITLVELSFSDKVSHYWADLATVKSSIEDEDVLLFYFRISERVLFKTITIYEVKIPWNHIFCVLLLTTLQYVLYILMSNEPFFHGAGRAQLLISGVKLNFILGNRLPTRAILQFLFQNLIKDFHPMVGNFECAAHLNFAHIFGHIITFPPKNGDHTLTRFLR